jgi:uncharacterized protein (DUF2336 family)
MSVSLPLINELEAALECGSSSRRTDLLRRITDLFLSGAKKFSAEQVSLFEDVFNRLVDKIENRVIAELSERLAAVDQAPVGVIRRLASEDDIVVAAPVLQHSRQLSNDDLLALATSKSQEHLLKISARAQLAESVTEVIVDRGNAAVLNEVAGNAGARFSSTALSKIIISAEGDDRLTATVAGRGDIPPLLLRQVLARATDAARERLMTSTNSEVRARVGKILVDISRQMGRDLAPQQYAHAESLVRRFSQDTELTKSKVLEFARARMIPETVVALSVLAAVPLDLVDGLVADPGHLSVLVLCRAVGLDWRVARSVLLVGRRNDEEAPPDVESLSEEYERLSPSTAQTLLRFWQARQDHMAAPSRRDRPISATNFN